METTELLELHTKTVCVYHNLVKYYCYLCDKEFIVSEYQRDNSKKEIICPYCHGNMVEPYVWMNEDLDLLDKLGIRHFLAGEV